MQMLELIAKKRAGKALNGEEIRFFVRGICDGTIPDEQTAAFLMAVCFVGMEPEETAALTMEMANSGDVMDLSALQARTVDKHSTGGVGDKTTLILAPIVAALGGKMIKMSGRGLGHTGGTIDKLEAIPGFQTTLSANRMIEIGKKVGAVVVGQSGDLAPADKKLYALRDGTGTVQSIPLIASSIMSKKIAAGCSDILLDVKVGSGAFMKETSDALELAKEMVAIGRRVNRSVWAILTGMEQPLGNAIGNALEVNEALEVLKGGGPEDLRCVILALATRLALLSLPERYKQDEKRAEADVKRVLSDHSALEKCKEMVIAQGGDPSFVTEGLPLSNVTTALLAEEDGYLSSLDGETCGFASALLGAGRMKKGEGIDHGAGILLAKKVGDRVKKGDLLATLYASDEKHLADGMAHLRRAYAFSPSPVTPEKLLFYSVSPQGDVREI